MPRIRIPAPGGLPLIRAALFDLDDTLLSNDMDRFLPAYLQLLSQALEDRIPAPRLTQELMRGTAAMLANRDPEKTLRQVFAEVFYPALGESEQALAPRFEAFYRGRFEDLKTLTRPKPEAPTIVEALLSDGYLAAIATNPMMPALAVSARLRWAGLPPEDVPFALVASYEQFHFAKPDLAFFAELTAQLGLSPEEAAMIGNSLSDDIEPAAMLGLATFHVGNSAEVSGSGGSLQGVPAWVSARSGQPANPLSTPASLEARLRGDLAALRSLCASLEPVQWAAPGPEAGWSATEIVSHLRDVDAEINLPRLELVLSQDDPFLPASDPDQWAIPRGYRNQSGTEALQAFGAARKQLLSRLQALGPEAWERSARHAILGPTRLRELLSIVAEHDLLHLRQMKETINR